MRSQIKKDIHVGHQGVDTCLQRAREYVFWPGMSKEIKEWIQACEACRDFKQTPCKEPLMSHDIPERAWEKIGCDLLSCRSKDYLITVCYKSNFWELDRLTDTKSTTVIKKLKADSWSLTMGLSLCRVNFIPSPRAGVLNTPPHHLTTAKPTAKLNQP